jgi:hypothetical protein
MKKLTFIEGLVIGFLLSVFLLSTLIETFYVSRDTLKLGTFYMDRKFYKRCEVKQ